MHDIFLITRSATYLVKLGEKFKYGNVQQHVSELEIETAKTTQKYLYFNTQVRRQRDGAKLDL